MIGRTLSALLGLVCAITVASCFIELARGGQIALALATVVGPICLGVLLRGRLPRRRRLRPSSERSEAAAAVLARLSEPDRLRVVRLAASGNAIAAIKTLREALALDLRTAKEVVEGLGAPDGA